MITIEVDDHNDIEQNYDDQYLNAMVTPLPSIDVDIDADVDLRTVPPFFTADTFCASRVWSD